MIVWRHSLSGQRLMHVSQAPLEIKGNIFGKDGMGGGRYTNIGYDRSTAHGLADGHDQSVTQTETAENWCMGCAPLRPVRSKYKRSDFFRSHAAESMGDAAATSLF